MSSFSPYGNVFWARTEIKGATPLAEWSQWARHRNTPKSIRNETNAYIYTQNPIIDISAMQSHACACLSQRSQTPMCSNGVNLPRHQTCERRVGIFSLACTGRGFKQEASSNVCGMCSTTITSRCLNSIQVKL
jgi:hypothetical protein